MIKSLVVPTIRENCIHEFIEKWNPLEQWDYFIVIEDNPTKTFVLDDKIIHVSWKEIESDLGESNWIISKHDSAIKCYGFYLSWKLGVEKIFALDDDCYPISDSFVNDHLNAFNIEKWTETVPGKKTRGIPYKNKGRLNNVVLNHGLWSLNPDLDACHILAGEQWELPEVHSKVIPIGQYFSFCGMNFCFDSKITPLMYFPLMGKSQPYDRFDDIWCGIIMKKVCDHLGHYITSGHPIIKHYKASDPFVNLVKEAPGIAANEWMWETIDSVILTALNPVDCMLELGCYLNKHQDNYVSKLGQAIQIWASLFLKNKE